ncbi:MAG: T9SS type A sorting domain-containing protein [Ignavibacteria bacterium]|nr:T9SS type A sorting domain-containing protein [Ignavibacteria bacterium]
MSIVNENIAYACGRYYGSARVIRTTNKGASWNLVFSDTTKAKTLIDIYFWTPDSGIAVGGSSGDLTGNAVVIKTTDGGNSWLQVHKTSRTQEWCWKISFISRDIGFVSIERFSGFSYILKTTNNGNNWTEIAFRNYDEEGIGFINENTGWVGGWTGPTYLTTNGGADWQLAGWGTNVNRFRFLSDTLAYAVGDRVYKYTRGSVGVHNISGEIPNSFKLYQNYPNPFNPNTTISYSIVENGFVNLKVYDALGKEVRTLVYQNQHAGTYEVNFDASDLSTGIYLYKFESGNFSEVKRMLLIK